MNQNGIWLSILEYASTKKVSISTLRRGIKSNQLLFKEENGKYFIWAESEVEQEEKKSDELLNLVESLSRENKKLKEEIDDLKTLLSIYETPIPPVFSLPPIPEIEL